MSNRSRGVRRVLVWAAATVVWSCGSSTETDVTGGDAVASIVVTPPTPTLAVGAEVPLQATVQDATGKAITGVSVLWSVQDPKVARVSSSGVVTGLAVGTTQVAANANGKSGIAAITVQKTPVASVVVLPEHVDATPGAKTPLTGIAYDAAQNALTDRTIIWTTSNELVATVDAAGMVTAVSPGSATITGTAEGKSDVATVNVTQAPIANVAITPSPLLTTVGQSTQMTATATAANGTVLTGRPVTWTSSDNSVASISSQGLLTAVISGTATITATTEGKTATATVTVSNAAVLSVSIQPQNPSVVQNATVQLSAVVLDVNQAISANRAVTWTSSNTSVATVSGTGLAKGIAPGSATITATSEGKSGSATLTVTPIPVATVTVAPPSASVTAGKTTQLTATAKDANGNTLTGRAVAWSSSNSSIASVSETGLVTGVAPGSATITATSETKSGTSNITVLTPILAVGSVTLAPPTTTIIANGRTTTLVPTVKDAAGTVVTDRQITWSSSNASVATVSSTGVVTSGTTGTATITATAEGKSGTSTVTVQPVPVGSVTVAPATPNVIVGTTTPLTVTVKDLDGTVVTDRAVTWSSSANAKATVSQTGVVTGVDLGTATITATSEGKNGTATVTIVPVPVGSVVVAPANAALEVEDTTPLGVTVKDANGKVVTDRVVTWTSSNNAIATVSSGGLVTAIGPGTATITATSETKSGTSTVVVTKVPVGSVVVQPATNSVIIGQTKTLTATVKDRNGKIVTDRVVTWGSSNTAVATVSAGVVTGVGLGTATITATSEGQPGTAVVTVTPVPVGSVTVTPPTLSLTTTQGGSGSTATLTAVVKDLNGTVVTDRSVSWATSNNLVATVTQAGLVTAVAPGSATISASSEHQTGSSGVTVNFLPVATVTVSPTQASILVAGTANFTATLKDALGNPITGPTVTWSTGNNAVATVSSTGVVTGVSAGSTTVTATSDGKSGSATINVTLAPVSTVTLQPSPANVFVNGTAPMTATLKDAAGNVLTGRAVTWSTGNNTIATVSSTGLLTGVAAGSTTVTATSEGKSGSATVTVTLVPVATVTVTPSPVTVQVDETVTLTATLRDANNNVLTGRTVTWTSNNTNNATVSSTGVVTGKKQGGATITATSEGKTGTASVQVMK
jgi:uncharacterized protein YjdB